MIRATQDVDIPPLTMTVVTDPAEIALVREQMAQLAVNSAWLQAHALEVYSAHRGKFIAVAGQELFVADTVQEVMSLARAAHPNDRGIYSQYIPRRVGVRIYANQRFLVRL